MAEYLSFSSTGNIFTSYVNSTFEEEVVLPNIGLYALLAVRVLIHALSLARGLRDTDKANFTTCLQHMQALCNELLETKLTHDTFMQHVEQKLDERLFSVSYMMQADRSQDRDELKKISR